MRSSSPLARLVLIVSALVVLAMVAVLYLALRPPLDSGPAAPAASLPERGAPADGPALPAVEGEAAAASEPLPPPAETPVERLGPNAIVGRVVDDATGEPVDAFHVDVLPWEPGPPPLERLAAAHDRPERSKPFQGGAGVFRIERKPGRWDVIVHAEGYLPGVLGDVTVPREDARPTEIRMLHGPSLTGVVSDAHGRPAPAVPVFLHVTRQFTDEPPPRTALAHTDALGRFRFSPLPPGEYAISLLEQDNEVDRLTGLRVESGTVDVSLPMQPRHQIVIVVNDEAGRPVQDAVVELSGAGRLASERSNPSGQAVVRYVADGEYELSIEREGYEPRRERLPLEGGSGERVLTYRLTAHPGS